MLRHFKKILFITLHSILFFMDIKNLIGCTSTKMIGNKNTAKYRLITSLLSRLLPEQTNITDVVSLSYDQKGCPHLRTQLSVLLNISFSYCEAELWSAIALDYPIGIDVESAASFDENYPYDLIFSKDEQKILSQFDSDPSIAAAGMWSCKEAVVKSRQSGFSDLAPLDVQIVSIDKSLDQFEIEVIADHKYDAITKKDNNIWRTLAGPSRLKTN